jgi:hypothetical protein
MDVDIVFQVINKPFIEFLFPILQSVDWSQDKYMFDVLKLRVNCAFDRAKKNP